MRSLYGEHIGAPVLNNMHSETALPGFKVHPFFRKYAEMFVPPIYLERAKRINAKHCPGFLTQWEFEWDRLVQLNGFPLHRPRVDFWTRQDDNHLHCLDLPMSEVYRSAYLRAIAWAADEKILDPSFSLWHSAQTCPIDLGLWSVLPGKPPDRWPNCEDKHDSIDTLPGRVTAQLKTMWQKQLGEEWLIAEASGRILESNDSVYDLEIIGVIQSCAGRNIPEIGTISTESGTRSSIIAETDDLLTFGGAYERQSAVDYQEHYSDWSIWRLAAPAHPNTVPRWQWWRFMRGVWLPSPFLARKRLDFRCTDVAVVIEEDDNEVAHWTDWTHQLRELTAVDLTPSSGQMLVIHRSLIDRAAANLNGVFAWICKITTHHRKGTYTRFKEAHFALDFGTTRIIQDGVARDSSRFH